MAGFSQWPGIFFKRELSGFFRGIRAAPRQLSKPGKCRSSMRRNMIRFITFDFILRIFRRRVMRVTFVIKVTSMYFDDCAGNPSRFGVPAYLITHFEFCCHRRMSYETSAKVRFKPERRHLAGVLLDFFEPLAGWKPALQ
jgi:hypothetical protein